VALWDSDVIPSGNLVPMPFAIATRPALMKASGAAAALLLCVSVAYAAAAGLRDAGDHRACFEQTSLIHPRKSLGGPPAPRSMRLGFIDLTTHVKRGQRANVPDDDEAIQNDVPAARIEIDDRRVPALLPLGVLQGSLDRPLTIHTFSPRSPRGPPTSTRSSCHFLIRSDGLKPIRGDSCGWFSQI
jgi:hypothetical protein